LQGRIGAGSLSHEMSVSSSGEGSLKERFRETARLAILDAAEGIFAAHGFDGARVDDIAAAAGVSVGTLYNYFGDRQQLLLALLERRRQEVVARLDEVLRPGQEEPFSPLLERFVRALLSHFDAHRALFQLAMEEEASYLRGATRRKSVIRDITRRAERLVQLGIEKDAVRADDAAQFPVFLVGIVRGATARAKMERRLEPLEQLAPLVVRFFLSGAGR